MTGIRISYQAEGTYLVRAGALVFTINQPDGGLWTVWKPQRDGYLRPFKRFQRAQDALDCISWEVWKAERRAAA